MIMFLVLRCGNVIFFLIEFGSTSPHSQNYLMDLSLNHQPTESNQAFVEEEKMTCLNSPQPITLLDFLPNEMIVSLLLVLLHLSSSY